jgi:hypothetical protein
MRKSFCTCFAAAMINKHFVEDKNRLVMGAAGPGLPSLALWVALLPP